MRLIEWLKDATLCKAAKKLYDGNSVFREMLGVLNSEHPLRTPLEQRGPNENDRTYRLGLVEGYEQALSTLQKLWLPAPPAPKELIATFEPPEE